MKKQSLNCVNDVSNNGYFFFKGYLPKTSSLQDYYYMKWQYIPVYFGIRWAKTAHAEPLSRVHNS